MTTRYRPVFRILAFMIFLLTPLSIAAMTLASTPMSGQWSTLDVFGGCPQPDWSSTFTSDAPGQASSLDERLDALQFSKAAPVRLPLPFVENRGQENPEAKLTVSGRYGKAQFTETGVVLSLKPNNSNAPNDGAMNGASGLNHIKMAFVEPGPECRMEAVDELPGRVNYLIGNDSSRWITGIPTFSGVVYHDVWPGISVAYRGDGCRLKYDVRVGVGANPDVIRFGYQGVSKLAISDDGKLHVSMGSQEFVEEIPGIYQVKNGKRVSLDGGYILFDDNVVGFRLDGYDPNYSLVIDPTSSFAWSTLIGGSGDDAATSIALDSSGAIFVTGYTYSSDFTVTTGSSGGLLNGDGSTYWNDAFVCKLDRTGTVMLYSTFFGGCDEDTPSGIAVDPSGCAYVVGYTYSVDFPTTPSALDRSLEADYGKDGFVTKLSADGSQLVYSTLLGGSDWDIVRGIAVDTSGSAYVVGSTYSSDFPTTGNAICRAYEGERHEQAFVSKMNPSGSTLAYSTFLEGHTDSSANSIALDPTGCAYVTGYTCAMDFPTTTGAYQHGHIALRPWDVFVSKLNPWGNAFAYSAIIGTGEGFAIRLDHNLCAYVVGYTQGASIDEWYFPTTPGAYDTHPLIQEWEDNEDIFVFKLNNAGSDLIYSTFLGSIYPSSDWWSYGLAVDSYGCAYLPEVPCYGYGETVASLDKVGILSTVPSDYYSVKLNATGSDIVGRVALGWSYGFTTIAVDSSGVAYVAGCDDNGDACIAKLSAAKRWVYPPGTTFGVSTPYQPPQVAQATSHKLKGQLHCHWFDDNNKTGASDTWTMSPEELERHYKGLGYNFVALTEHNLLTVPEGVEDASFVHIENSEEVTTYCHLLAVGVDGDDFVGVNMPKTNTWLDSTLYDDDPSPFEVMIREPDTRDNRQQMIDDISDGMGGLAFIPHVALIKPGTDNFTKAQLLETKRVSGIGVFTSASRLLVNNNGFDTWNYALAQGKGQKITVEGQQRAVPLLGYVEDDYTPPGYYVLNKWYGRCEAGATFIILDTYYEDSLWGTMLNGQRSSVIKDALRSGRWWNYWADDGRAWTEPYPDLTLSLDTISNCITVTADLTVDEINFIGVRPYKQKVGALESDEEVLTSSYIYSGGECFIRVEGKYKSPSGRILHFFSQPMWVYPTGRVSGPYGSQNAPAKTSVAGQMGISTQSTSPELTVDFVPPFDYPETSPELGYIRNVYAVSCSSGTCPPGAKLTLSYAGIDASSLGEGNLRVYHYVPSLSSWLPLISTLDSVSQELTCEISELGMYTISAIPQSDREAPQVSIVFPDEGSNVAGSVKIVAEANDNVGVAQVVFYINDVQVDSDSTAADGWLGVSDVTHLVSGSYKLKVEAVDINGNRGSLTRTVIVTSDATSPVVTIDTPAAGSDIQDHIEMSGTATDRDGTVAGVTITLDGMLIGAAGVNEGGWTYGLDCNLFSGGSHRIGVVATDEYGNSETVEIDVSIISGVLSSVGSAKNVEIGTRCEVAGLVVTATSAQLGGFFYAEDRNRASGIRISANSNVSTGQVIKVAGELGKASAGELELRNAEVNVISGIDPLLPLGMSNRSLGGDSLKYQALVGTGSGLSNVGLFVRTWGRIINRDESTVPKWFVIDDGSGVGVTCLVPLGVVIAQNWDYVCVSGISSCQVEGGTLQRTLLIRDQEDIKSLHGMQ